jgi:hypothetical protein
MKSLINSLLCIACTALPLSVHAQFFQCKDASGRTITSDRPIPECAERPLRELNRSGTLKRDIPPPPTAEEKRQKLLLEEKQKAEALAAEEKMKADRVILARYGNEKGIEAARKRALEMVADQIKREINSVNAAEAQLKQTEAALAPFKKRQAAAPADLRAKQEEAEQIIREGKKIIQDREAETIEIGTRFDETLKRYREITTEQLSEAPKPGVKP